MSTSIHFDSENFGKLFIRLFVGMFFAVSGVYFFTRGHSALAVLGTIMGLVGIHFSPVLFGGILAAIHIVCGLTMVIGFLFRWSCFLLGLISLLEAGISAFTDKSIIGSATQMFTISMATFGMMFMGSGRFAATKK